MDRDKSGKPQRSKFPSGEISAWPSFLKAHAVLVARIEDALRRQKFPQLEWYDVLWTLEQAPEGRLRMGELAQMTVITRSNLTRLIDRLAAKGLVERDRDLSDRRGAFAVLTPAGRALRKKIWPHYLSAIQDVFDRHLSRAEAKELRVLFQKLIGMSCR